ncbi:hypothetical protein CRG98_031481 [Punica granatum]|uniref:Uncharacterized protein n=1 Tax=Punica granatum TaxID=22663 RepID=A0A2I0IVT3_PUNGR|nr:hypothetical protein CRG98_031481 [Punica granatum]
MSLVESPRCADPNFVSLGLAYMRPIVQFGSVHLPRGQVMNTCENELPLPVYDLEVDSRQIPSLNGQNESDVFGVNQSWTALGGLLKVGRRCRPIPRVHRSRVDPEGAEKPIALLGSRLRRTLTSRLESRCASAP